jgi:ADP-heptose:LPS heptosyltransferase
MTNPKRVCVFYSKGRTLLDALKAVKSHDPEAVICVTIPSAYSMTPQELEIADEVLTAEKARYGARDAFAFLRLAGMLRHARYDAFVILFDTPRQRILASLVHPGKRLYCRLNGAVVEIKESVPRVIADAIIRAIAGRVVYIALWAYVRVTKTRAS